MKLKKFIEFIKEDSNVSEEDLIKRKFIMYVNTLPEFIDTNEQLLKEEEDWDEEEEEEDFSDEHFHQYVLFNTWRTEEKDQDTGKMIKIDDSIKYFICGNYHVPDINNTDYYVYENGEFRSTNSNEDNYFRALDDEIMLGNQDNIFVIDYDDWKLGRKKAEKAVIKINEE